jgi:hypothetical protein
MVADEPRTRHRGFFLHSAETAEPEAGEHENPEGVVVRVRVATTPNPRQITSSGRSRSDVRIENTDPQIRSGSVTGSRQRAHLPR